MFRIFVITACALLVAPSTLAQETTRSPALTMVRAFAEICGRSDGDPERVAAAALAAGWTRGGQTDGINVWHPTTGGPDMSLLTGRAGGEGKIRWLCSLQLRPPAAVSDDMLKAEMGPTLVAIDGSKGLYIVARSGRAVRSGDTAFVSVSGDATYSGLLYIRPPR